MRANDERDSFSRCLMAFYGERKFSDANIRANPSDIPRLLGQTAEFWEYWDEWSKIGGERRQAATAIKEAATEALNKYF